MYMTEGAACCVGGRSDARLTDASQAVQCSLKSSLNAICIKQTKNDAYRKNAIEQMLSLYQG